MELTECTEVERGTVEHVFGGRRLDFGAEVTCGCGHVTVRGEQGNWLRIMTDVFTGND